MYGDLDSPDTNKPAPAIPPQLPAAGEAEGKFTPSARASKTVVTGQIRTKAGGSNRPNVDALKGRTKDSDASVSNFHVIAAGEDDEQPLDPATDFRRRVIRLFRYDGYKIRPDWNWSTRGLSRKELEEKVSEAILQVLRTMKGFEIANSVEELVQCQAFTELDCVDTSWDARDEDSEVLKSIVGHLIERNGRYKVRFSNVETFEYDQEKYADVRNGLENLNNKPRKGILKNWTPPQEPFRSTLRADETTELMLRQHDELIEKRLEEAERNKFLNGVGYGQFEDAVVREKIRERIAGRSGARHQRGVTIVSSLEAFRENSRVVERLGKKIEELGTSVNKYSSEDGFVEALNTCEEALSKIRSMEERYRRIGELIREMDAYHSVGFDKYELLSELTEHTDDIDRDLKNAEEDLKKVKVKKAEIENTKKKILEAEKSKFLDVVGHGKIDETEVLRNIRERVAGKSEEFGERNGTVVSTLASLRKSFRSAAALRDKIEKWVPYINESSSEDDLSNVIQMCAAALGKCKNVNALYRRAGILKREVEAYAPIVGVNKNELLAELTGKTVNLDDAWKLSTIILKETKKINSFLERKITEIEDIRRRKLLDSVGYGLFGRAAVRAKILERLSAGSEDHDQSEASFMGCLETFAENVKDIKSFSVKIRHPETSVEDFSTEEHFEQAVKSCRDALEKISTVEALYGRLGELKREMEVFDSVGFDKEKILADLAGFEVDIDHFWQRVAGDYQKVLKLRRKITAKKAQYELLRDSEYLREVGYFIRSREDVSEAISKRAEKKNLAHVIASFNQKAEEIDELREEIAQCVQLYEDSSDVSILEDAKEKCRTMIVLIGLANTKYFYISDSLEEMSILAELKENKIVDLNTDYIIKKLMGADHVSSNDVDDAESKIKKLNKDKTLYEEIVSEE